MIADPVKQEDFCCLVSRITDIPAMPMALQRYLNILHDEVASLQDLESVVRYDQSLSAKILRMANSSYYGFRGSISSLSRAMILIGFEEVKRFCMCSVLLDLVSNGSGLGIRTREKLWKHAFAVGKAAGFMADKRPWVDRENAYFLGLLHDFGKLILAVHFLDHFQAIEELVEARQIPFVEAEKIHGIAHGEVGSWVGRKWGLPELYLEVMEFHHQPEKSLRFKPEVTLLHLANILANSRENPELLDAEPTLSHCRELRISEEEWIEFGERMAQAWVEVEVLWKVLS